MPACEIEARAPLAPPRGIVLVVGDTVRRDRLSAYGGTAHTPHFDALAERGVLFTRASSAAPWTKPSVATLFTGLYPSQHGILDHPGAQIEANEPLARPIGRQDALPDEFATLAETFASAGWQTAAFVANPWLDRRFGFAQGFATYEDGFARWGVPGTVVSQAAVDWIAEHADGGRFFVYVHHIDAHRPHPSLRWEAARDEPSVLDGEADRALSPAARSEIAGQVRFTPDAPPAATFVSHTAALLRMAYDRGVENWDAALGVLLDGLARQGLQDEVAVVVTADHGEALFEHGWGNHGHGLYDEEIAVPLAIAWPGLAPGRESCPVGLIDLFESFCRALGAPCPADVQGRSFLPGAGGEATPDGGARPPVLSEGVIGHRSHRALRDGRYLLLYEPGGQWEGAPRPDAPFRLYDQHDDPAATRDLLAGDHDAEAGRIRDALAPWLLRGVPDHAGPLPEHAPLDPGLESRLRELGYVEDAPPKPEAVKEPVPH
jgi:arylsulfatase A-like enzyme